MARHRPAVQMDPCDHPDGLKVSPYQTTKSRTFFIGECYTSLVVPSYQLVFGVGLQAITTEVWASLTISLSVNACQPGQPTPVTFCVIAVD